MILKSRLAHFVYCFLFVSCIFAMAQGEEPSHWAFEPIVNPKPPQVVNRAWPSQPLDYFVLHQFEASGLKPASPAERHVLIRRIYFDLTGLPPAPQQIHEFVNNPAPDAEAFAAVVEQLLDSPQYGERWGRHWTPSILPIRSGLTFPLEKAKSYQLAMDRLSLFLYSLLFLFSPLYSQVNDIDVEANLKLLEDPDMNVRIAGLRKLQYSLDPRIPEACLPLLKDEGNSIRPIAARAIGSRWHQIPKDRIPVFIKALEAETVKGTPMSLRAIGLLKRDYREAVFSQSASKRWVIYGRYRLPCLIDTSTETEELLGWKFRNEDSISPWFLGHESIKDRAVWHPRKDVVALEVGLNRYESEIWIWKHRDGLKPISAKTITPLLGLEEKFGRFGYQECSISKWDNDDLLIAFRCVAFRKDSTSNCAAVVAWNCETKKLRKISLEID